MDTDTLSAERVFIYWRTDDIAAREAIRKRFSLPDYITVNGWIPVEVSPADKPVFEECAARGFFGIIRKKWRKNGGLYVSLSRK